MILINGAFYSDSEVDEPIITEPLFVTSAGHHSLVEQKVNKTIRPNGRRDYQILYVKKGRIHYYIEDKKYICPENSILIYRPNEPQIYSYYLEHNPDIYWVHFTGNDVESWLKDVDLQASRCYSLHQADDYARVFDLIIFEYQYKLFNYAEIANTLFKQLLYYFSRGFHQEEDHRNQLSYEVESAIEHFNNYYNIPFDVNEFAKSLNISVSWFTRQFKTQIGISPHKYLINLRINKSKSLMSTNMNIGAIAEKVGFNDPLYFSRIFHQITGFSPSEYKKQLALKALPIDKLPWKIETRDLPSEKT